MGPQQTELEEHEEHLVSENGKKVEVIELQDVTSHQPMIKNEKKSEYTDTDDIENLSSSKQILAALAVDFGGIIAGSTLSWTSPCLSYLEKSPDAPFRPSVEEASWIGALLGVGALIAAIPSAWAADKYGRRAAIFLFVCAPYIVSWPIAFFSQNIWQLFLARLLAGMGVGGVCTLAPMYCGETAGENIRSKVGSFFPLAFCTGILLTYVLIAFKMSFHVLTVFLGFIPFLATLAVWALAPESPVWLVRRGYREKALRSLKALGRSVKNDLPNLEHEIASAPPSVSIVTIFKKPGYRMRLIACVILFVFQQFSGINAVMFYTVAIFEAANSGMDPVTSSCLVAGIQVVAVIIVAFVIDKAGRKFFLLGSAGTSAICHLALGIYFHLQMTNPESAPGWLPLTSLMLFVLTFAIGFGSVPWIQVHELSPGECAATLNAVAMLANWATGTLVTKTFGPAASAFGENIVFYAYAAINAVGVFLVALLIPETRFKAQHEIFRKYKI